MMQVSPERNNESRCYDPKQLLRMSNGLFFHFPQMDLKNDLLLQLSLLIFKMIDYST